MPVTVKRSAADAGNGREQEAERAGLMSAKTAIADELVKALRHLGAKSDLLRIVGSYGDTLDDAEVLEQLRKWSERKEKPDAS